MTGVSACSLRVACGGDFRFAGDLCLPRAGIEPTVTRNLTGNQAAEALLNSHLQGGVPSTVIRVRGGPPGTSLIE